MAYTASSQSLSIEALQADLEYAQRQRDAATKARLVAQENENQWITEVSSLTNLIDVRRKRLQPPPADDPDEGSEINIDDLSVLLEDEPISHVVWISNQVAASGTKGISPPEILKLAEEEGRKMHKNYPYIVLRKLVQDGKVTKRAGRYSKKG